MVLIGLGTALWSTSPYNVPVSLPGITWQGYTFTGTHIMAAVLAGAIAGLLYLLLHRTRYRQGDPRGRQQSRGGRALGHSDHAVLAMAFGLGVALAGASGTLIATMFPFTVLSGEAYQLKSFVVTVLGGLGNPAGALFGGIALGLVEGLATPFMPVSWTPIIEFGLFVLCLIAFPRGIFAFARPEAHDRRCRSDDRRRCAPLALIRDCGLRATVAAARHACLRPAVLDATTCSCAKASLLAAVYIILASNLNLMIGYAGYVNFGNIVFFGLGGYVCVYLVNRLALAPGAGGARRRHLRQRARAPVRPRHPAAARRLLRARDDRRQRGGTSSS